jgi:hypothetical protein
MIIGSIIVTLYGLVFYFEETLANNFMCLSINELLIFLYQLKFLGELIGT